MKIQDVVLFEKIVALNSISAGGQACGLTATVSSDHLKRLESDLGCTLLNRTTRSISLTADGRAFLQYASDLIETYEAARHSVGKNSTTPVGRLTVAAPALFAKKFLPDVISAFLDDYPETQLSLKISDEIQNYTAEGIDVAIRIGWLENSSLIAKKISENRRILCASPLYLRKYGTPSHPTELENHNCIIFVGEDSWRLANGSEHVRVKVSGRFDTNSAEMATQAALEGQGIALRSLWDVSDDLRTGRLVQILKDYEIPSDMAVYVIYPPRKFISLNARSFVDLLMKQLTLVEL